MAAALVVAIGLAGCGAASGSTSSTGSGHQSTVPAAAHAATGATHSVTVAISDYAYHPAALTVTPGTHIRFVNHDQTAHTATTSGSGFDTGTVAPGGRATVVLTKSGDYHYYCQFHPFMTGTVVVK